MDKNVKQAFEVPKFDIVLMDGPDIITTSLNWEDTRPDHEGELV